MIFDISTREMFCAATERADCDYLINPVTGKEQCYPNVDYMLYHPSKINAETVDCLGPSKGNGFCDKPNNHNFVVQDI